MTNYENFNSSSKSFRIFCDKLSSTNTSKNLILESTNNNIELKVVDGKKIIFKNDLAFNASMDLNNKPLQGLTTISAESLNLNNIFKNSNLNIINKSIFTDESIDNNNKFLTSTNVTQDLSSLFFYTITVFNNSSVIVDINITLYCSYALNERITVELWRDLSMLVQSKDLGTVIAGGGIPIPYSITYLDENLTAGPKKYYIKYKLENNISGVEQGIINVQTSETSGSGSIILREVVNTTNYSNKIIFDSSNLTTTSYDIQDLSALFYNTINVFNTNVQVNINANLYCCYGLNERLNIEVWRDLSMISQSINLGTINATGGLIIPYSFNYLDTDLSNGPKKYYLKYKLERDPSSNNTNSNQELGIVNLNTLYSIGTSSILLANVSKISNNLIINNNNRFLTTTSEIQDLSGQLFNNIEVDNDSVILVDLNITLYCCYAANERITVEIWRDLSMISQNINIGNIIATQGLTINYRISFLDEDVSAGTKKYYLKYKLETNLSAQPQGIININGGYNIIEKSNIGISYNVLSYNSIDGGYIKNTKIGYNPNIEGDKGSSIGRRDAYFRYIDVNGSDSHFNDSLYVKKNIFVDSLASITSDLSVNAISLNSIFDKLSIIEDYIDNMINGSPIEFSNNSINTRDLSAINITISNELYVLNKYYANDLNISGQLLSNVLRVPHEFTIDPSGFFNHSGSFIVNGDLIVRGNKKLLRSSILDISAYIIKIATNLRNIDDISRNPAGFDISYIAALHYDGIMWNISGGNLLIENQSVALDVSLIDLQNTISGSLITSKSKYDFSFGILQTNITNSFNILYSISAIDNSYVTKNFANTSYNNLKNYIDLSFITKQNYSISGNNIVQTYVDGSFSILNRRLDLSFALKNSVEISYNNLFSQFESSFNNFAVKNVEISSIIIENIRTAKLALSSHTTICGSLIVIGDTSSNSLTISNSHIFNNNGYSSIYRPSSIATSVIEEYYSKFNNFGKVFYILADGSLYYLTGRGAISDSRLKENIVDASPKLQDLLKVRIVDYNLKDCSNKKYIGVVAQELEEIFPGLVSEDTPSAQAIEYGKSENYKSVTYSCFNVMLIKALQEQQQIITNLSLRLERLKENNKQMQRQ
jgi:predicted transport protein